MSDFRQLNRFYPASAKIPRISHSLTLLRLVKSEYLVIGDCKSAFYRIRLAKPVWIHAGGKDFLCYRMAFGLSMGPEGFGLHAEPSVVHAVHAEQAELSVVLRDILTTLKELVEVIKTHK